MENQPPKQKNTIWEKCAILSLWVGMLSLWIIALFFLVVCYAILFGSGLQVEHALGIVFFAGTPCGILGLTLGLLGFFLSEKKKESIRGILRNASLLVLGMALLCLIFWALHCWFGWHQRHPEPQPQPPAVIMDPTEK